MKFAVPLCLLAVAAAVAPSRAFGDNFQPKFQVIPVETDNGAGAVASFWRYGLGCPPGPGDPGCPNPFERDPKNQGLVLAKSVSSIDPAQAIALIKGARGTFLTELGWDLRKFLDQTQPNGSECTDTTPRWEFETADGASYFIPCQALLETEGPVSLYWRRQRGIASTALPSTKQLVACPMPATKGHPACSVQIGCYDPKGCGLDKRLKNLRIVHDKGPDSDRIEMFGIAVLDNIDVAGRLRGTGPDARNGDEDEGQGRDKDGRQFYHLDSPSHPEQGQFEFHDPVANVNLIGANGVRGIAYSVGPLGQPCVSFSGDGAVNGSPGYLYTFASCDLSAVGTDLGTYTITITGPIGTLPYNQTGALTMGSVDIHK